VLHDEEIIDQMASFDISRYALYKNELEST